MSVSPLSWKNIKRLGREYDRQFLHATALHSGLIVAVDTGGQEWYIDRRSDGNGITAAPDWHGGTSRRILSGLQEDDEFGIELRRRLAELGGTR